jgi:hypothetical protein
MGSSAEGNTNDHVMKEAELIFSCSSVILRSIPYGRAVSFLVGLAHHHCYNESLLKILMPNIHWYDHISGHLVLECEFVFQKNHYDINLNMLNHRP